VGPWSSRVSNARQTLGYKHFPIYIYYYVASHRITYSMARPSDAPNEHIQLRQGSQQSIHLIYSAFTFVKPGWQLEQSLRWRQLALIGAFISMSQHLVINKIQCPKNTPSVLKNLTFRTAARSPKYNIDLLSL
jgi:hypothetical protein